MRREEGVKDRRRGTRGSTELKETGLQTEAAATEAAFRKTCTSPSRRKAAGALRRRIACIGGRLDTGPLPAPEEAIRAARQRGGRAAATGLKRALKCRVRGHAAVVEFDAAILKQREDRAREPGFGNLGVANFARFFLDVLLPGADRVVYLDAKLNYCETSPSSTTRSRRPSSPACRAIRPATTRTAAGHVFVITTIW